MSTRTEEELRLAARIYKTQDGKDLVELFEKMLYENHMAILEGGRENRAEVVGFGMCLMEIRNLIVDAENKLIRMKPGEAPDRI